MQLNFYFYLHFSNCIIETLSCSFFLETFVFCEIEKKISSKLCGLIEDASHSIANIGKIIMKKTMCFNNTKSNK